MKKILATLAALAPSAAFAAQPIVDVNSLNYKLVNLGNTAIGLLISFAVIWIIFMAVRFIMSDGEARAGYRNNILWGVVGLAIILSIWGLVAILTNTFPTATPTQSQPVLVPPNIVP